MSDEYSVIVLSGMQFLLPRLPIVVLHRVEEHFSSLKGITVIAMHLCADRRVI
jgi:hypothetical protein